MKLYRLATFLELKYFKKFSTSAEHLREEIIKHIKTAIGNASMNPSATGIMPFLNMIVQDSVNLRLEIVKNDKRIDIKSVLTSKPELDIKYKPLAQQIKTYLEKNWELFPSKSLGDDIDYDNFSFQLDYSGANEDGIATR